MVILLIYTLLRIIVTLLIYTLFPNSGNQLSNARTFAEDGE